VSIKNKDDKKTYIETNKGDLEVKKYHKDDDNYKEEEEEEEEEEERVIGGREGEHGVDVHEGSKIICRH